MFGTLGGPEVLLLLVLALIVFGPRKLPEIGKSMGRMLAEFRRASNDFKRTLEDEVEAEKLRAVIAEEPFAPPSPVPPAPAATADGTTADERAVAVGEAAAPPAHEATQAEPATAPPALRPPDESISRG
jgi:Tat protein translocase TatB subunit